MNNKTLMISSSVLAASLFLGAGSAQAHTTNNNMNQQDMEMNEEMGHMNNNMDQQGMEMGHMNNNMGQQDMAMNEKMGHMNNNMGQQGMEMNEEMGHMNNNMGQQDMAMNEKMGHMNNNMDQQGMEMGQTTMMPYYNYDGNTTYDGQFTKDYDFVRALQHDNVMIDGYKVNTAASDKDVASSKAVYNSMIDINKDGQVIHITFETKPDMISKEMFEKAHMTSDMVNEGQTTDGTYLTYETNNGMYKAFFDKHGYLMKMMIS
ncbi:immunodominant staphylococcal antigen IsaB family protein [Staphylococcus xylosus]|uniref:immunodominant staphylococcal antigen IsaB family protein n=1 Tax=Staphylococcus xylosus TaxID=1288 RepID=UPI003F579A0C